MKSSTFELSLSHFKALIINNIICIDERHPDVYKRSLWGSDRHEWDSKYFNKPSILTTDTWWWSQCMICIGASVWSNSCPTATIPVKVIRGILCITAHVAFFKCAGCWNKEKTSLGKKFKNTEIYGLTMRTESTQGRELLVSLLSTSRDSAWAMNERSRAATPGVPQNKKLRVVQVDTFVGAG